MLSFTLDKDEVMDIEAKFLMSTRSFNYDDLSVAVTLSTQYECGQLQLKLISVIKEHFADKIQQMKNQGLL